jgi:hypothetical protein
MPRAVHSPRRVRFAPFPQVSLSPRNTNAISPLDDFTFNSSDVSFQLGAFHVWLTWRAHFLQVDQSVVLAALSDIDQPSPNNNGSRSTRNQNEANADPIPPRPSIAHIFINNECFMSRSKEWTRVLDPVRQHGDFSPMNPGTLMSIMKIGYTEPDFKSAELYTPGGAKCCERSPSSPAGLGGIGISMPEGSSTQAY